MSQGRAHATTITDRDRFRACCLAHLFGVSVGATLALLAAAAAVGGRPVPPAILLPAGCAIAVVAGLLADLAVRPPRVEMANGWLTVTRLGRTHRVNTGRLTAMTADAHAAGGIILADEDGNSAEIDARCLVRNPLMWEGLSAGVNRSRQRGLLEWSGPARRVWEGVGLDVRQADSRAIAHLDFALGEASRSRKPAGRRTWRPGGQAETKATHHGPLGMARPTGEPRHGGEARHIGGHAAPGFAGRLAGSALLLGWITRPRHRP